MTEHAAAPITTPTRLSKGTWYLAENCLQDLSGCTTTGKVHRWGRAWAHIRGNLDRSVCVVIEGQPTVVVDFEKGIARGEGESDTSWQGRALAFNLAHTAWKETVLEITLSAKHVEAIQQAVRHATESKKLAFAASPGMVTNYSMQLVAAFDPAAAEGDS